MSAAVALMLEGMPSPRDLHLHRAAGRVVVLAGSKVIAEYGETDTQASGAQGAGAQGAGGQAAGGQGAGGRGPGASGQGAGGPRDEIILDFVADDVDAEYPRIAALGVDWVMPPTTQPWGNRSMIFRDPSGNLVNVFSRPTET